MKIKGVLHFLPLNELPEGGLWYIFWTATLLQSNVPCKHARGFLLYWKLLIWSWTTHDFAPAYLTWQTAPHGSIIHFHFRLTPLNLKLTHYLRLWLAFRAVKVKGPAILILLQLFIYYHARYWYIVNRCSDIRVSIRIMRMGLSLSLMKRDKRKT